MNILIFNWRDIKNPLAGGSEIYFHELAKRWALQGNKVTIICSGWRGCKKDEIIDGIKIVRVGNDRTLYFLAPFSYWKLKIKPDLVIDVENGIPFFSPLFAKAKKFLHIHHVHKDIWFKELTIPLALLGRFLETKIMPLIYSKVGVITLSKSSKFEIEKEGLGKVIGIVNPGISFAKYKKFGRSENPSILFLNRIKKYKGLDVLLRAVEDLKRQNLIPDVWVAGNGSELKIMKNYATKHNLSNVKFFGRISEEKKQELMQKAWIFVNPSFKEGWGIVNIEANYFGTPIIGSDVGGIRDSVINGKTGLLFEYGNSEDLKKKIKLLLKNKKIRDRMSKNAKIFARKFDWNIKAKQYLNLLEK